jgi:hypothetical protein
MLIAAATPKANVSIPRIGIALPLSLPKTCFLIARDGQCAAARSLASSSGEGKAIADIGSTQTM